MIITRSKFNDKFLKKFNKAFYGDVKNKPEIEIQLFEIQKKWIDTLDYQYIDEMESVCLPYARSILLKKIKVTEYDFLDESDLFQIYSKACRDFCNLFLRKDRFCIGGSFGGRIYWNVLESFSAFIKARSRMTSLDLEDEDNNQYMLSRSSLAVEATRKSDADAYNMALAEFVEKEVSNLTAEEILKLTAYVKILFAHKNMSRSNFLLNAQRTSQSLKLDYTEKSLCESFVLDLKEYLERYTIN